jgi:hypothetical protein
VATFTTSSLAASSHTIAPAYSGDQGYVASSAVLTHVVIPNRAPMAANHSHNTLANTTLTIAAPGVLGSATDADGNALTAVKVTTRPMGR